MESSSETNQSSIEGYSTPPRSNRTSQSSSSFSFLRPKLLTSSELKRRFSPIHSSSSNKKRRYNLIRKMDSIVPLERNLNMPVILQQLYDNHQDESTIHNDCIAPLSSSSSKKSKIIFHPSIFDNFMSCSLKTEQENIFSISETIMREKLKILLEKK